MFCPAGSSDTRRSGSCSTIDGGARANGSVETATTSCAQQQQQQLLGGELTSRDVGEGEGLLAMIQFVGDDELFAEKV